MRANLAGRCRGREEGRTQNFTRGDATRLRDTAPGRRFSAGHAEMASAFAVRVSVAAAFFSLDASCDP